MVNGVSHHPSNRLLTADEVADQLGTSTRFVRRLMAERRIGFVHLGRHVRIAQGDVDAFIAGGRVDPVDAARIGWRGSLV